jgi:hypothetical protein
MQKLLLENHEREGAHTSFNDIHVIQVILPSGDLGRVGSPKEKLLKNLKQGTMKEALQSK